MKKFVLILLFTFSSTSYSQYIQVDDTFTAQQLVNNFFAGNSCGQATNVSVSGGSFTGAQSFGSFNQGTSTFPFNNGIVLSTGRAVSAIGPNTGNSSETIGSWAGDQDLEQALGLGNTLNATILEFDFTPYTNKISFDYIFSSEQYLSNPSPNQCGFTDGFAFLIKPTNGNYQNIALVPGTNIPVSVNTIRGSGTVCPASNEAYFDAFNGFNHPTTFNGQTKILKAQADVIAGNAYHIKLVIADQGNGLYDSAIFLGGGTFQSETDLGPDHLMASNNAYCAGDTVTLNASQFGTGNTYRWYKDNVFTGIITPTFTISDNTNQNIVEYKAEVMINGTCLSTGTVKIQFAPLAVLSNQTLVQCDSNNDGSATFNLTKLDNLIRNNDPNLGAVTYYESIGGNQITIPTAYNSIPKTIYARVAGTNNCSNYAQVTLSISNNNANSPVTYQKCDEDGTKNGITSFDLNTEITPLITASLPSGMVVEYYATATNAENQSNPLANNYSNTTPNSQTIFARIVNGPDCYDIVDVVLHINFNSPANFENQSVYLCPGQTITLSVVNTFNAYNWSNGDTDFETQVSAAGNYTVEVTDNNGCKATKTFNVLPSAPATNIDAIVNDFSENNSITITYTDNGGDYEFSIDGVTYQDSPVFNHLEAGEYTVYVRDKNGCTPTPSAVVYVLDFPKFFTPNGDGYNDTWKIENLQLLPVSTISIFDRYGKLIKQFTSNTSGWNGTYNGKSLPADDYWFILTFSNGKTVKSHFTLKR
ncbi:T9SS type B sorting domain-containing protein [Flavobacterium amniphilum]|uniref:choice-of-anchor L domain-containing protein n=1 Tax=Flavobacterium amniphilum TaxID=1834035 RepID=UPI002029B5CB|nr:choice-of-anchor L domain-containing protein [Flavobacterium amniphilum]MCL9805782.1 T9SS type B sorting domain-containing protein [Flavobacterium amniphilum]MCL9806369.1 T9SS type B sorting domain-containing protein [Flavobacterium amniphilum]